MVRKAVEMPIPQGVDKAAADQALRRFGFMVQDTADSTEAAHVEIADLVGRADLLEGVVGYGNVSMVRNEWVSIINGSRPALLFGAQVGPMKGVHVSPGLDGLVLESPGLWRVDCCTMANSTPFTGDPWVRLTLEVYRPASAGGTLYDTKVFQSNPSSGQGTVGGPHTFVTPAAGYQVRAFVESGRWRTFLGGTVYSTLSANKWDNRTTEPPPGTVPTGPGSP